MKLVVLFAWSLVCSLHYHASARRNLTDITYRFTNCDSTSIRGPRVEQQCRPLYEDSNSPITHNAETLFQFENFDGVFDGAQGFRIPRDDLYNITVAGASGGEGVCNFHYGTGGVIGVQVWLSTEYEYLVMVGHEGASVCNVSENRNNPVCQSSRPWSADRSMMEAQACNQSWYNWTQTLDTLAMRSNVYDLSGGGGGGGASMIWPRRTDNQEFTELPIMIAPGGGGASAVLDYETFVRDILPLRNYSVPVSVAFASDRTIYDYHVRAKVYLPQYDIDWPEGERGFREPAPTSGSGGGWQSLSLIELLEVDGRLLNQPMSFAQGGFDCLPRLVRYSPFESVFGGYGGGGGGCGSGGGGGGYTGGHVIGGLNIIPGSGGENGLFDLPDFPLRGFLDLPLRETSNFGNGFVEIVASNCGCSGQCVVYTNESQFECLCPNGTLLADDLTDCFEERSFTPEQKELFTQDGLFIQEVQLSTGLPLFSLSVPVSVSNSQRDKCVMILFNEELQSTLVSNVISGSGTIDSLSVVTMDSSGSIQQEDLVRLLSSSALVTGVWLVSTGGYCTTQESSLLANVSIKSTDIELTNSSILDSATRAALISLATSTLRTAASQDGTNTGAIVGAVLGTLGFVILITVIAVIAGVVYHGKRQYKFIRTRRHKSLLGELAEQRQRQQSRVESLEFNTAYVRYKIRPPRRSSSNSGYEALHIDSNEEAEVSLHSPGSPFEPMFGIRTPRVDFCTYNRQRSKTAVRVTDWSYPRSKLTYMRELGEGQFGKVLLMQATDIAGYEGTIPVAVKTLTSRDPDVIQKFTEEAELMKKFSHPNVVSLLGFIAPKDGEDSAPLMILEYMQYGDLHGFLVSQRPSQNKPSPLMRLHFYTFAYDVAQGLEFLSRYKYVHRDVAARNCLVGSGLQIKIADFGLARGINNKDYYRIAGSAVLPVRWMSPESLLLGKFSTASDIWAYGVLIWEILTFGQLPLPDMDTQDIIEDAQNGTLKHSRPHHAPEDMYGLISTCHQLQVEDRPSFGEIIGMELFDIVNKRPALNKFVIENSEPNEQASL